MALHVPLPVTIDHENCNGLPAVPREVEDLLQAGAIRLGGFARLGNGRVAQAMGPDFQPGSLAQIPHDSVKADAGEPPALLGPVEIREQRTGFLASGVQPCLESAPGGFRDAQNLF